MRLKGPIIKPRRVTRKELSDHLYELRRPIMLGVLALLLVIFGWWGYRTLQARREMAAQALLTDALHTLERASPPTASPETKPDEPNTPEQALALFHQISLEYPSSKAAEQALLQIGNTHYALGNSQEALAAYQRYLQEYPHGSWLLLAGLGKAYALEAQGQYTAAASVFRNLAEHYRGHSLSLEALTALGRCLELAQDRAGAIEVYRRVVTQYPGSNPSREAEVRLAVLER